MLFENHWHNIKRLKLEEKHPFFETLLSRRRELLCKWSRVVGTSILSRKIQIIFQSKFVSMFDWSNTFQNFLSKTSLRCHEASWREFVGWLGITVKCMSNKKCTVAMTYHSSATHCDKKLLPETDKQPKMGRQAACKMLEIYKNGKDLNPVHKEQKSKMIFWDLEFKLASFDWMCLICFT